MCTKGRQTAAVSDIARSEGIRSQEDIMPKLGSAGSLWNRDGTYYGVWYRNGARFCENLHTGDEAQAQAELRRLMEECEEKNRLRPEKAPPSAGAILGEVLRHYRLKERKSLEHVERHVKRLRQHFRGKRADEITRGAILDYAEARKKERAANATINRELAALRLAYSLARKGGSIKPEMVPAIEMLPETNRRKGFFEQEEYEAVLAKLPEELKGGLTLGYWTGMRKEEIFGLEWDCIDLFNRLAFLEETKNGEPRTLPLNEELYAMFERQAAGRWPGCPYVFHRGPDRIHDFRKAWATATKAAGCPARLFHDLRRSGVRNLIRSGVAQSVAMLISGHKDARIFERYNIVDARDVAEAMRKVSEYEARKRAARMSERQALGSHGFTEAENGTQAHPVEVTIH